MTWGLGTFLSVGYWLHTGRWIRPRKWFEKGGPNQ